MSAYIALDTGLILFVSARYSQENNPKRTSKTALLNEEIVAKKVLGYWSGQEFLHYTSPANWTAEDFNLEKQLSQAPFDVTTELTAAGDEVMTAAEGDGVTVQNCEVGWVGDIVAVYNTGEAATGYGGGIQRLAGAIGGGNHGTRYF